MTASTFAVTVEWGDCDGARIAFYPNFFRWMDAAAWHLFAANGFTREKLMAAHGSRGLALVDARASFRRPARAGDVLEIETTITHWGAKSFELRHTIRVGGEVAVEGGETRIWATSDPANPEVLRAGVIPEAIKKALPAAAESTGRAP
jgi:4-hydroxybenzoyl-CoA thioesterase